MSATTARSVSERLPDRRRGLAVWLPLRSLKILLPFVALVAAWWAIYLSADFSPQVLVLASRRVARLHPPGQLWRDG